MTVDPFLRLCLCVCAPASDKRFTTLSGALAKHPRDACQRLSVHVSLESRLSLDPRLDADRQQRDGRDGDPCVMPVLLSRVPFLC